MPAGAVVLITDCLKPRHSAKALFSDSTLYKWEDQGDGDGAAGTPCSYCLAATSYNSVLKSTRHPARQKHMELAKAEERQAARKAGTIS